MTLYRLLILSIVVATVSSGASAQQIRQLTELSSINIPGKTSGYRSKITISFKNIGKQNLDFYAFRLNYTNPNTPFPHFTYFRPNELSKSGQRVNLWTGTVPVGGNVKIEFIHLNSSSLFWSEFNVEVELRKDINFEIITKRNGDLEIKRLNP
jgi:hypothetical protein